MNGNAAELVDGMLKPLDPRWPAAERVSWYIFNSFATVAAILVSLLSVLLNWFETWLDAIVLSGGWIAVALLWWLAFRHPQWIYARTRYALSEAGMEIHRGLIWRSIINVPRSRIQHTDVHQGPVSRQFGLARLTMYTAGTQHASVILDGLNHESALAIRDFLLRGGEEDAV